MDIKKLNEKLEKYIIDESNEYKLSIITDRDRDAYGELTKTTFTAKNDLEALLYVFKNYNLQNAGMFNGYYEDDELEEDDIELKNKILNCVKENKIEEGIKLLTDLYFDGFDPSDYYDDIIRLENPQGKVIFEDNGWDESDFEDEDDYDEDDYDEDE